MDKIAVIGDYDSIFGFAALGLDIFPAGQEDAAEVMHKLTAGNYGIIYITEELAEKIPHIIAHYQEAVKPASILIPGVEGNTGRGIEGVKKSVEQAVGSDILFSNHE